jgi:hypothetical protein
LSITFSDGRDMDILSRSDAGYPGIRVAEGVEGF